MNFFTSSLFPDLKLPEILAPSQPDPQTRQPPLPPDDPYPSSSLPDSPPPSSPDANADPDTGAWNFGGLVKSIALKSEGILQAYRKDLEEFGAGLRHETKIIAEVAVHAVKDLPTSLETSASMAQESIESVGQVIEDFSSSVWRGTVDIIAQGKDAVLMMEEDEFNNPASSSSSVSRFEGVTVPLPGGKYSRFEAQVRSMQHDSRTYCDEPEDAVDYAAWNTTFDLSEKKQEIETLLSENTFLKEIHIRFVPAVVDEETFWTRYFYKFHKLRLTEAARENLVKRASAQEEEDLTWDIDDDVEDVEAQHVQESENVKGADFASPDEAATEDPKPEASKSNATAAETVATKFMVDSNQKAVSKVSSEDEDDLGWEVAGSGAEEFSSKRSSNSEASWELPEVPRDEVRRKIASQDQSEEDLSWDVDDDDDGK